MQMCMRIRFGFGFPSDSAHLLPGDLSLILPSFRFVRLTGRDGGHSVLGKLLYLNESSSVSLMASCLIFLSVIVMDL